MEKQSLIIGEKEIQILEGTFEKNFRDVKGETDLMIKVSQVNSKTIGPGKNNIRILDLKGIKVESLEGQVRDLENGLIEVIIKGEDGVRVGEYWLRVNGLYREKDYRGDIDKHGVIKFTKKELTRNLDLYVPRSKRFGIMVLRRV